MLPGMLELPGAGPVWLSFRLAAVTTLLLLIVGTPLAWWLSATRSRLKPAIEALVALPIVLPPTVLGFYLLLLFNPGNPVGGFWVDLTGDQLSFSFAGLVIASMVYSLPFVVQPIQNAFESVNKGLIEAARTLGASATNAFLSVSMPLAQRGFLTAVIMGFAHTLGEFGVVLMVGGNIPGETRTVSIAIYDQVESLNYAEAHGLSVLLLVFSFFALMTLYMVNRRRVRISI